MTTQKDLDLEMADKLENFVTKLSERYEVYKALKDVNSIDVDETEYNNLISALRYAIASLRSNG